MKTTRKFSTSLVAAGMVVAVTSPTATGALVGDDASVQQTGCLPQHYDDHVARKSVTYNRAPVLTHARGHVLAPSGSRTVTLTAAFETRVEAEATINAGGSVEADAIFGKVEGHFDVTVRVQGSRTSSYSVQVQDRVSNPTGRNKKFIAFEGVTKFYGSFTYVSCGYDQQVHRERGRYSTYNNQTSGIPRCGAGHAGSAITRLALKTCAA